MHRIPPRQRTIHTAARQLAALARAAGARVRAWLTVLLSVAGLALFTAAGFTVSLTAGLIVGGISLLVLGYYAEAETTDRGN